MIVPLPGISDEALQSPSMWWHVILTFHKKNYCVNNLCTLLNQQLITLMPHYTMTPQFMRSNQMCLSLQINQRRSNKVCHLNQPRSSHCCLLLGINPLLGQLLLPQPYKPATVLPQAFICCNTSIHPAPTLICGLSLLPSLPTCKLVQLWDIL